MVTKNKPLKLVSSTRMIKCRTDMYGQITNRYGFSELTMIGENLKYLIIGGQEEAVVYNKNTKVFFRQDINYNNFFYIGNSFLYSHKFAELTFRYRLQKTPFYLIGNSSMHKVSALSVLTRLTFFYGKFINSIKAIENFNSGKISQVNSIGSDYGINNMPHFTYLKAFEKTEHIYKHAYKNRLLYDGEKEKYISITDRLIFNNIINDNMMSDIRSDELLHVRNQWYFRKKIDYSVENIDTAQIRISGYKNPLMQEEFFNRDININKHIVEELEKKYKISLRGNAEIIKVTDAAQKTVTAEKLMIRHISIIYNRLRSILRQTENLQIYFMKNISRYRKNIQTYFEDNISEYNMLKHMENKRKYLPDSMLEHNMLKHIKNIYGYPSGKILKHTEYKWKYPTDSMLEHNILKHKKNIYVYLSDKISKHNMLKHIENKWENSPDNILKHRKNIHEYLSGNILNDTENIWEYSPDNISEHNMLKHIKNIYGYLSGNISKHNMLKHIENKWEYPPYNILKHIKNIHNYLSENILKHNMLKHIENTWEYRSGDVLKHNMLKHRKNIHEYKSGNMSEDAENIWKYKSGDVLKHKKNIHEYLSGNISEDTENIWKYKYGNILVHKKNIHEYLSGNISKNTENTHKYSSDNNIWKRIHNIQVYSIYSILSYAKNIRVYSSDSILSHTKKICAYSADSILSYTKNIHLHSTDSTLRNIKTIQMYLKGDILSDSGNIKGYFLGKSLIYSAGSISGYTENISKDTRNSQEYYKQIKTKDVSNENRLDVSREKLVYTGQSGYKEISAEQKTLNMENIQNINDIQNVKSIQSIEEREVIKGIQSIEGIQITDGLQAIQKNVINRTENIDDILLKQEKIEEINKMIDVRVQSQVKNISRQVYETIERRLKGEKRRRGF